MTSPRRVKRSSNVHTESCNPASGVNFVTFKKTDMAGESFSTLQMRHILDGVQQQMSDKTTTLTKLSDGSMKLGGKRSAPNTDSFKIANIPGTDSGSNQLVSVCDFRVKVQTYTRSRWYNLTLYDSTHLLCTYDGLAYEILWLYIYMTYIMDFFNPKYVSNTLCKCNTVL